MDNSGRCEICNIDVHRASFAKHLRSKKHSEKVKQEKLNIPEWLFKESFGSKIAKIYSAKSLKQIAREKI